MSRMIIKVCGLREEENIREVERLDVDLTGFIFYPRSSRYVPLHTERERSLESAPVHDTSVTTGKRRVGVFVNDTPKNILLRVCHHQLDYLQLHGEESPAFVEKIKHLLSERDFGKVRIIKALRVGREEDISQWEVYRELVDMLLYDTSCSSYGGSGTSFDWSFLMRYEGDIPFLLSGGIGPGDADKVLSFNHPMFAGIDLNSRFETVPARKDVNKLRNFIQQIRNEE